MPNEPRGKPSGGSKPSNQGSRQQGRRPNRSTGRPQQRNQRPRQRSAGSQNVRSGTSPARAKDLAAPPKPQVTIPVRPVEHTGNPGIGKAVAIALVPALVVGIVLLVILIALGAVVIGVIAALVVGAGLFLTVWFGSERFLVSRLGGSPIDDVDAPRASNLVDGLCATMGLPLPEMVLLQDQFRGALVLGRNEHRATLVLTSGLLWALDPVELEGVLAHELSHIKSGDVAAATIAAAVLLPIAPIFPGTSGLVLKLAGNGRELHADLQASSVTRYPPGLRDALAKMAGGPAAASPSPIASRGVGRVLRWLWTVVPELEAPRSNVGLLDSASTRVAALDEA
ncbi:MAG: M48 family metalloprotease [Acidimicrobiales bacterium]